MGVGSPEKLPTARIEGMQEAFGALFSRLAQESERADIA